ncbi:hypothetical protein [Microseira sp. BLCC-F43]|uniref:hypothetical protein n=1 Tax=Microseira sp. BLCC-F43 TaxID=3153602 RepID=UPI0035B91445
MGSARKVRSDMPNAGEDLTGIQSGLDDFEAGRFREFEEFAQAQRRKYNLPTTP